MPPGLVGPVAIYAKGKLDNPGVEREIPLLYNIQNEMQSVYFQVSSRALTVLSDPKPHVLNEAGGTTCHQAVD